MPTSTNIDAYPFELFVIVERVITTRETVEVKLSNIREARALRFQVYGLRRALIENTEHPLSSEAPKLSVKLSAATLSICHVDKEVPEGLRKAAEGLL